MSALFVYGTLRHRPLLEVVLGRGHAHAAREAVLSGHRVFWARGQSFPMIARAEGHDAQGLLLEGLGREDLERLDFFEAGFDFDRRAVGVKVGGQSVDATVYFPVGSRWETGDPWSLDDWVVRWGEISVTAAREVMDHFGKVAPETIGTYFEQIRQRAASRVRAVSDPAPMGLRSGFDRYDVRTEILRRPYLGFFMVEEQDLRHARFSGGQSARVTRAAFVSGDAVTVLPYDPVRDRVMLVEQFRFGPHARGDAHPWTLEPIAGRIDPGETPEQTARREAVEEAGLTIGALDLVARYYPSTGAFTEYVWSYVGLADLPDAAAGLGGAEAEHEDIRSHVIGFDVLMGLVDSGEADNAPLILTAQWLAANRARLRSG